MRNMTTPARAVSFEDALRNLASKLTGKPASALPRTQEGVVQYMAERIPSVDELAEAVTCEVLARMGASTANDAPTAGASTANDAPTAGADAPELSGTGTDTQESEGGVGAPAKAKSGRKKKTDTDTDTEKG